MSFVTDIESNVFPRQADLEGIIEESGFDHIRKMLRDECVFPSCRREDLGAIMSRYLFSESFYEEAFGQIERKEHGVGLTGVRFTRDGIDGLRELIEAKRNVPIPRHKYNARFVAINDVTDDEILVTIRYDKINPRFTAFRRRETFEMEATISLIAKDTVEISAPSSISTDSSVLRDLALHLMEEAKGSPLNLDLTALAVPSRVDLFDQIVKDDTRKPWRIGKCCGFSIRDGNTLGEKDVVMTSDDVQVLRSAILEGQNLRNHQIVKGLIGSNYFFSSATFYAYQNNSQDYEVKLKVEFKQSPNVLMVVAEGARVYSDSGATESRTIDKNIGRDCVRHFWEFVHAEFQKMRDRDLAVSKKVARSS